MFNWVNIVWRHLVRKPSRPHDNPESFNAGVVDGLESLATLATLAASINQWAMLERQIESCLWIAIDKGPDIGFCITKEIQSVRTKLLIFESILAHRGLNEAGLRSIRRYNNDLVDLTKRRNRLIHDPKQPDGIKLKTFEGAQRAETCGIITRDQLDQFTDFCIKKHDDFFSLAVKLLTEVGLGPSQ